LRGWVTQAEIDAGGRPGPSSSDTEKIAQLKRDNRELRRANGILRSASAFFAAELDRLSLIVDYIEQNKNQYGVERICTTLTSADLPIAARMHLADPVDAIVLLVDPELLTWASA
jgi:hypothetical protein